MRDAGCSRAPLAPSRVDAAPGGQPDLLRVERFGALRYARRKASFEAVPTQLARLLVQAQDESILDLYARRGGLPFVDDEQFAAQVARWRGDGLLDASFRCTARVVNAPLGASAIMGPLVTHLQLTIACNLRCDHCYVDVMAKPAPDELTTAEIVGLFAELESLGSPVVVLAGGEPMLRRDLPEILEAAGRHGIDAWLCTNGTLVTEESARWLASSPLRGLSISLDGPDAATHERLRGAGRFDHALRGIRRLVEAGARDVQLRVTVTPHNADRLADFWPLATSLGVDKVVFKPFRQSGAAGEHDELLIDRAAYLRAIDEARARWPAEGCPADFGDGLPQRAPEWTGITPAFGCVGGTTSVSILHDGRVVGCGSVLRADDWTLRERGFAACWREAPGVASWRAFAGNDECRSCGNFSACGGGCRARAVGAGLDVNEPDPWAKCSEDEERVRARRARRSARLPILAG